MPALAAVLVLAAAVHAAASPDGLTREAVKGVLSQTEKRCSADVTSTYESNLYYNEHCLAPQGAALDDCLARTVALRLREVLGDGRAGQFLSGDKPAEPAAALALLQGEAQARREALEYVNGAEARGGDCASAEKAVFDACTRSLDGFALPSECLRAHTGEISRQHAAAQAPKGVQEPKTDEKKVVSDEKKAKDRVDGAMKDVDALKAGADAATGQASDKGAPQRREPGLGKTASGAEAAAGKADSGGPAHANSGKAASNEKDADKKAALVAEEAKGKPGVQMPGTVRRKAAAPPSPTSARGALGAELARRREADSAVCPTPEQQKKDEAACAARPKAEQALCLRKTAAVRESCAKR